MTRVSERERPLQLQFVLSAPNVNDLPPTGSEIAVAGRSNVGKSSLINALANRNGLAAVSKTPGRTQLLNCFRVDDVPGVTGGATFVDLPGYGYAKAPGAVRARWGPMIEGYLLGRQGLRLVMVLVDAEVGPTRLDLDLLTWLQGAEVPYAVVATKFDKVKSSVRQRRKKELAAGCGRLPSEVTWVSAAKHTNIDLLRRRVREWLAEPSPSDG